MGVQPPWSLQRENHVEAALDCSSHCATIEMLQNNPAATGLTCYRLIALGRLFLDITSALLA